MWMLCRYPDQGSASDRLKQISHVARLIRSTTQIWEVILHQYRISALNSQTSNVSCILRAGNEGLLKVFWDVWCIIWISGFGILKQNLSEIQDWKYHGRWDAKKKYIGITGLHEIGARDYGIEVSYWAPSITLLGNMLFRASNHRIVDRKN